MPDPTTEPTLPPVSPREPNTPRNLLRHLWDWATAHPDLAIAIALIVVSFILGRCTA